MKELTKREMEVAKLLTWGASAKEISLILILSTETVGTHIKNIKRKLGLSKSTEIGAFIFCTEYHVPIELDRIGHIRKIVSTLICLFLFVLVEYQQLNYARTAVTRTTTRTASKRAKKEYSEDNSGDYETALG